MKIGFEKINKVKMGIKVEKYNEWEMIQIKQFFFLKSIDMENN